MYEVVVMNDRLVIARAKFKNERAARAFYDKHNDLYRCEFKDLDEPKPADK